MTVTGRRFKSAIQNGNLGQHLPWVEEIERDIKERSLWDQMDMAVARMPEPGPFDLLSSFEHCGI
jgi:hypothetical protein